MDSDDDPHFGFHDEFEDEMDNFWKDENPSGQFNGDESDYLEDVSSIPEDESDFEEISNEEEVDQDAMDRILAEEEDELIREHGLENAVMEEHGPEKIILDQLNVEKLINMLSHVRLVWPEDMPYYDDAEFSTDPERAKFPSTFYQLSDKEKTVMWHAENFRRQFAAQFPRRRPLLIAPKNECGCQKLFPTYINPTVLGYPEFLDCLTCAKFMKDFLSPEIMDPPTRVPDRTRSHLTVLKDRKANCFEFTVILVSFLNGAGYDAYVVDGFASKTLCTMDSTEDYVETDTASGPSNKPEKLKPLVKRKKSEHSKENEESTSAKINIDFMDLFQREDEEQIIRPVSPSKYRFKKGVPVFSQYEMDMQKRDGQQEEGKESGQVDKEILSELDANEEEQGTDEGELETGTDEEEEEDDEDTKMTRKKAGKRKPPEKYYAIRTHAWALVLPGSRDVEQAFFIDPFSGCKFEITDENFLGIEAVFNHKNFYVNIQDGSDGIEDFSYDLNDSSKWSKLLLEPEKKKKSNNEEDALFQDEEDDTPKKAELLLEMPTSWTPDLDIPQEDYERRYPGGKKTFNYNDAIVELAAPYVNDDGLVKKVLKFDGPGRNPENLIYIEEMFEHRKDKLARRKWTRKGRLLQEFFEKGRRDALKEHVHISGKNKPTYPRDLYYYANSHPQNVAHRQIIRKGMIEHFEDRDDLLYYRFTTYGGVLCDTLTPKRKSTDTEGDGAQSKSKAKEFLEMLKGDNSGPGAKKRVRRKINKIIEKYHCDESKDYQDDIAENHMLIDEGRLRVLFHYGEGNLTRNSLEFFKPRGVNFDTTDFKPEDCIEYQADRNASLMDVYKKFKLLLRMEADQRVASVLAIQAEDEVYQTVTSRVQEDWRHEIEPDAFAGDRNEEYVKMKEQKVAEDEEDDYDVTSIDFTSPFFEKFGVPKNKQEEVLMKKRIMLNSKVKLVKKAHAIRESYERESSHLREKLNWHDRHIDKMTPTQEEDFNHMFKERLFQMHIMEQRLARHQQIASKNYYNILTQVLKHPQLNRFSNKKIPPPKPVITEPTEEEKAQAARELAKAKDCCQFYTMKYADPKKPDDKKNQIQVAEFISASQI